MDLKEWIKLQQEKEKREAEVKMVNDYLKKMSFMNIVKVLAYRLAHKLKNNGRD